MTDADTDPDRGDNSCSTSSPSPSAVAPSPSFSTPSLPTITLTDLDPTLAALDAARVFVATFGRFESQEVGLTAVQDAWAKAAEAFDVLDGDTMDHAEQTVADALGAPASLLYPCLICKRSDRHDHELPATPDPQETTP